MTTTPLVRIPLLLLTRRRIWAAVAALLIIGGMLGLSGGHPAHGAEAIITPPEDCVPIQSKSVRVVDEGRGDYLVTDGKNRLAMAATRTEAERMAAVASRHEYHCFIGRKNREVEYWKGRSEVDVKMPPPVDCQRYNSDRLRAMEEGSSYVITDGTTRLVTLPSRGEARQALEWARKHKKRCFIGRDNERWEHSDYVMSYWSGGGDDEGTYLDDSDQDTYLDDEGGDTYLDDSGGDSNRR